MENLSGIAAFVKAVETGSLARAAAELGISAPAVSKSVKTLEKGLGVRLLSRTTRQLALTDEGALYYERCKSLVDEIQLAASDLREIRGAPRGTLRVSATVGFGRVCVAPLLPEFHRLYPEIVIDFHLDDAFSDLVRDRMDVGIRNGRLANRNIVARQIAPMQLIVCGSPEYFKRHAPPKTPEDLKDHSCLNFRLAATGRTFNWEFERDGRRFSLPVKGPLIANNVEITCEATVAGMGLMQMASYQAVPLIRSGKLVPVLVDCIARGRGHWLCYLDRRYLPQRIVAFADFICKRVPEVFEFTL
jgi:DNA-binding transcriptional LysR family regulator